MIVKVSVKGYFEENSYFCIDDQTGHGFLIDPGAQAEHFLSIIEDRNWCIEKILLTHGHFDHFGAAKDLGNALRIPVYAYEAADEYLLNGKMNLSSFCMGEITLPGTVKFHDGERVTLSENPMFGLHIIHTPGHTRDSVVLYSAADNAAFVGDTIFRGSIGNAGYPGGDRKDLAESIRRKIFMFPDETVLLSGHTEYTTVGAEKRRLQSLM